MKQVDNKRSYEHPNERNKHTRIKCGCGGHSFRDSTLRDNTPYDSNEILLDKKATNILKRKENINKKLKIRKARKE